MDFFSSDSQRLLERVILLPQEDAKPGPTGRPPNSYAIIFPEHSVLVDAPYSWTLDSIQELADGGHPPVALVLTHADVAAEGDAFERIRRDYGVHVLLHPNDAALERASSTGIKFQDPRENTFLKRDGLDVIEIPGHTPGSIMLFFKEHEGVLFAGDSAIGSGPDNVDAALTLERPAMDKNAEAAFCAHWKALVDERRFQSVMPLHGRPVVARNNLQEIVENLWTGPAMPPADAAANG